MKTYPQQVIDWVNATEEALGEDFFNDDLFTNLEIAVNTYREIAGQAAFESWVATGEVDLTDEDLETIMGNTILQSAIRSLREKKLIDWVEDEHGEPVYWVTELGKEYIEKTKDI